MNKNSPKISVVIPIYNVADYLPKCLNSVLMQTYPAYEVICVNDGSTDDCPKILQEYAKKDARIKIINQKNQGVSAARNAGLDAATGDYVSMPDPDDYLALGCFEKFVNILRAEKRTIDIFVFNGIARFAQECAQKYTVNKMGRIQHWGDFSISHFKDWRKHKGLIMTDMSICDKIFKREFIEKHHLRFPKGLICEDRIFGAQAQLLTKNIYVVEDYMYFCVQRLTSIWHTLGDNVFDYLTVSDKIEKLYKRHRFYREALSRHFEYLVHETYRLLPRVTNARAEKFIAGARKRLKRMFQQIGDKSQIEEKYMMAYSDILKLTAAEFVRQYQGVYW